MYADEDARIQQRDLALARANQVRTARAKYRQEAKAGNVDPEQMLRNPPPEVMSMTTFDVLRLLPGVGTTKAAQMCARSYVSRTLKVQYLRDHHVTMLLRHLPKVREDRYHYAAAA